MRQLATGERVFIVKKYIETKSFVTIHKHFG